MCIIGAVVSVLFVLFYVFVLSGAFAILMPKPLEPQITYGEFPFTLTYELDGKVKVIEDTIICEFDGFVNRGTAGKTCRWKTTLKSGNEKLTLLDLRPLEETNELGQTILELYFFYGTAAYYMGDNTNPFARDAEIDYVSYEFQTVDGKIGKSAYKTDVAYEKYKIRLMNWEHSPPIQNTFK